MNIVNRPIRRLSVHEGSSHPSEASMAEVHELLTLASHSKNEMAALRKRMREAENGIRLTEQSRARGVSVEYCVRKGWRETRIEESTEMMVSYYEAQCDGIRKRLGTIRAKYELLEMLIAMLPEMEARVITLRWIELRSWKQITGQLYICQRTGQRLQKRALERMALTLDEIGRDQAAASLTETFSSAPWSLSSNRNA